MESSNQLAIRFREIILDGKWIANTNFKDKLSDVTWTEATTKIGSLNTIAALTYHINYYIAGILNVFEGGALEIRDKYSYDMPSIQSQNEWDKLLKELWINAEMFANHVEVMSEDQLKATFVRVEYGDFRRSIEGMIEHSYYHLGQISLIKKMLRDAERGG